MRKENDRSELANLVQLACQLGVSKATVISAADISIEDDLAKLCKEPQCENYGLSMSCPPYVSGPSGFRKLLKGFGYALVFEIEVPSEILFSSERKDVFRLLHEIAADIERSAVEMGYCNSKAYAGGSCKQLFCQDHPKCQVLNGGGRCRNPRQARPSMSGFGINVSKLIKAAGWTRNRSSQAAVPGSSSMEGVYGLVLVG